MDSDSMKHEDSLERERDRTRRERPSRFSDAARDKSRDREENKRGSFKRLYVSNIPYEYRWQELKDLFREQVGEVAFVELFYDENEKSRGCGIIEFSSDKLGEKALDIMQGYDINGRKLKLKEDDYAERDKHGFIIKSRRHDDRRPDLRDEIRRSNYKDRHMNDGARNAGNFNTYGLSLSFLENLGIKEPLQSRIFVANLDYKVDAKKLREVFRLAGKVQNVDLSVDKEGNSRGFAVVEFDHPVESVQAISMFDHQALYDRRMTVRMDRAVEKLDHARLPEGLKGIGQGLGPNGEPLRDVAYNLPNNASNNSGLNSVSPQLCNNSMTGGLQQGLNLAALSNVVGGNLAGLGTIQSLGASLGALSNPLLSLGSGDLNNLNIANSLGNSNLGSLNAGGLSVGNNLSSGNLAALSSLSSTQQSNQLSFNRDNVHNQSASFDLGTGASSNSAGYMSTNFSNNRDNYNSNALDSYGSTDLFGSGKLAENSSRSGNNMHTLTDTLVINNLPTNCTWQDLRAKFRDLGGVENVEMRGKDTGLIRFSSESQAARAFKSIDGTRFCGKSLHVSYY